MPLGPTPPNVIAHTRSGGVSVNNAILHVVQHDLPHGVDAAGFVVVARSIRRGLHALALARHQQSVQ